MNKNTITILAIAFLATFLIGGFTGYKIKKCPVIVSTVTELDTVYYPLPIQKVIETKPINVPYLVKGETSIVEIHDTTFLDYPTFTSTDTLRHDSLYIAISDIGNCYGIIERKSQFGGHLTGRTVIQTITNNIVIPPPFISLSVGASASFSGKWNAFDVGPAVSLSFRQKHQIGYSYGLNTSTHNVYLQTKIK